MRNCWTALLLWFALAPFVQAEIRTWTDRTGKSHVEGQLCDFNNGNVWLKLVDGPRISVPLTNLSKADRDHVEQLWAKRRILSKEQAATDREAVSYRPGRLLANLADRNIDGSSGIAASFVNPRLFWTHNDQGADSRLHLFDTAGRDLGSCTLKGIRAFDWEDIASFRWQGKPYLLVADTGNNGLNSAVQMLYLIEEPPADPQRGVLVREVPVLGTIYFSYEDDFRDCEAIGVDPADRTVLLVSKDRGLGGHVYQLDWPEKIDPDKALRARLIATLSIPPATGMDISPDGRRAIVITYGDAYEFPRRAGETWAQTFARPPREIPMPARKQGESICYGADGRTLYLTSEQLPTPLWEVPAQ